ncbi:hypothetical protein HK405_000417, partial [Cladochytrium tenue]
SLTIFVYANALFECSGKVHRTYGKCVEWTTLDAYVNSVGLNDERRYNDLKRAGNSSPGLWHKAPLERCDVLRPLQQSGLDW